jgi:hypothetical protein
LTDEDDGTLHFDEAMYARIREGCQSSARAVVPTLRDLFAPSSVIDVGGGEGWWAAEFGCAKMTNVDRELSSTLAPGVTHVLRDLADPLALANLIADVGAHDVALCLEVAEHLPGPLGLPLVNSLCALAPIVVFSAAIPGQGGHGHVNEQWPGYWAWCFDQCEFVVSGELRWRFWGDPRVEPWYQQNLLVAMDRDLARHDDYAWNHGHDQMFGEHAHDEPLSVVHPAFFEGRR